MDKATVIALAREAGYGEAMSDLHAPALERFAALVAAHEREECAAFLERGVDVAGLAGNPVMQVYTVELLTSAPPPSGA